MSISRKQNFNRQKLTQLAIDKIEAICDKLGIEHRINHERVNIICPVHQSTDLASACVFLSNGCFKCWSRGCDEQIGNDVLSLIKWCLDNEGDTPKNVSLDAVKQFIEDDSMKAIVKKAAPVQKEITYLDPAKYPAIKLPSQYYIDRGFNFATLNHFGIGDSVQFPYTDRSIVPVHDMNGKLMGFSARSIHDKCKFCNFHHSKYTACIDKDDQYADMYKKWLHSKGLRKTMTLYGLHKIPYGTKKVVVVEGPSCVWKLYEACIPAVAVLGKSLSVFQVELLKQKGVESILFIPDNDEAGNAFRKKVVKTLNNLIKIYLFQMEDGVKDISDMQPEHMQLLINTWEKI